jgi:polysaccharide deacetylase 2 family uncharacterized protein YibQ
MQVEHAVSSLSSQLKGKRFEVEENLKVVDESPFGHLDNNFELPTGENSESADATQAAAQSSNGMQHDDIPAFFDGDSNYDADEDSETGSSKKKKFIVIGATLGILGLGVISGLTLFGGEKPAANPEMAAQQPTTNNVLVMSLPQRPPEQQSPSALQPVENQEPVPNLGENATSAPETPTQQTTPASEQSPPSKAAPESPTPQAPQQMTRMINGKLQDPIFPVPNANVMDFPAYDRLAEASNLAPLTAEVKDELLEQTDNGLIPRIGIENKEMPWQVYARPMAIDPADPRPRVSIILVDVGLTDSATNASIHKMPPEVTLAFSPYSLHMEKHITEARQNGHEVMLSVHLQPENFPQVDPGPLTLLSKLTMGENTDRLYKILAKAKGYMGVYAHDEAQLAQNAQSLQQLATRLARRGLLFIHKTDAQIKLETESTEDAPLAPNYAAMLQIDKVLYKNAIDGRLRYLENLARTNKHAIAIAHTTPLTLQRLQAWMQTLEAKNIVLVPASAIAHASSTQVAEK